jgi:hypothetical protein
MNVTGMKNSDWLAKFLKRIKFSPFVIGFVVLVINIVVDFTLAFAVGGLFPSQRSHGLLREPIALTADLLVPSFLIGYYCWIQEAYPKIFQTLFSEKIIEADEQTNQIINRSSSLLTSRQISGILLILSLVSGFIFAWSVPISDPSYTSWISVSPVVPWIRSLFNVLSAYVAAMLIFDIIVLIRAFSEIFGIQNIRVRPSHPDKAGGLGIIGRFSANLSYLIAVFGLLVSISLWSNTMPAGIASIELFFIIKIGGVILYLLMAPILFFLPLYAAHKAMVKFRDNFLLGIGKEMDEEYVKIQASYDTVEPSELERTTKRINYFRGLAEQVKDFPVWPFNSQNIRKFYGFVIGAILPGLTSIVFDMVGLLFK